MGWAGTFLRDCRDLPPWTGGPPSAPLLPVQPITHTPAHHSYTLHGVCVRYPCWFRSRDGVPSGPRRVTSDNRAGIRRATMPDQMVARHDPRGPRRASRAARAVARAPASAARAVARARAAVHSATCARSATRPGLVTVHNQPRPVGARYTASRAPPSTRRKVPRLSTRQPRGGATTHRAPSAPHRMWRQLTTHRPALADTNAGADRRRRRRRRAPSDSSIRARAAPRRASGYGDRSRSRRC